MNVRCGHPTSSPRATLFLALCTACDDDKVGPEDTAGAATIAGSWAGDCQGGAYQATLGCVLAVEARESVSGEATVTFVGLDWTGSVEGTLVDQSLEALLSLQGGGNFFEILVAAQWDNDTIEGRCGFGDWSTVGELTLTRTE